MAHLTHANYSLFLNILTYFKKAKLAHMKRTLLTFLLFVSLASFGQQKKPVPSTYPNLQNLINLLKAPLDDVESSLAEKGYVFHEIDDKGNERKIIKFVHKNKTSIYIDTFQDNIFGLSFFPDMSIDFFNLKKAAIKSGFLFGATKTNEACLISSYTNPDYSLRFWTTKFKIGEPVYMVSLIDKKKFDSISE